MTGGGIKFCLSHILHITLSSRVKIDIEYQLLLIACKEENPKDAEQSLSILYEEFREFVYNVVIKFLHSPLHKEEIAQSVTNDVFYFLYQKPEWSFDPERHTKSEGAFKAYLATVARNKLYETLRTHVNWEKEDVIYDDDHTLFEEELSENEFENIDNLVSENNQIIDEVLNTFSPRDKEIILTYFLYYEKGKNLPGRVLDEMEAIHKTTRPNIRQIVSRAKKKIKELAIAKNLKIT